MNAFSVLKSFEGQKKTPKKVSGGTFFRLFQYFLGPPETFWRLFEDFLVALENGPGETFLRLLINFFENQRLMDLVITVIDDRQTWDDKCSQGGYDQGLHNQDYQMHHDAS